MDEIIAADYLDQCSTSRLVRLPSGAGLLSFRTRDSNRSAQHNHARRRRRQGERRLNALPAASLTMRSSAEKLDGVRALIDGELEQVNVIILDKLQSEVSLIPELARHIIAAGGKRIRPILTLLAARLAAIAATASSASPLASSSSTPPRCCTTTWSTTAACAAAPPLPTQSGATRPLSSSATSCSAAPSSSWWPTAACASSTSCPRPRP